MKLTQEMVERVKREQDGRSGWAGLRGENSAFPQQGEPLLAWLVDQAQDLRRRTPAMTYADAMMWVAINAWYEGHIEGYDHGQRAARGMVEPFEQGPFSVRGAVDHPKRDPRADRRRGSGMRHELLHTTPTGDTYAFLYDDEDGGEGVVTVRGKNGEGSVTLPAPILMAMIHSYQLDTRYDHLEHREL